MICNPLFGISISASPMIFLLSDAVNATSIVPNWAASQLDTLEPPAALPGLGLLWVSAQCTPPTTTLGERCDLGVSAVLDKKLLIAVGLYCRGVEVTPRPDGRPGVAWAERGHRCQDGRIPGQLKKKNSNKKYPQPTEEKNRKQGVNRPITCTN